MTQQWRGNPRQDQMDGERETTGHHSSMRACIKVSFPLPLRAGSQGKCYPEKLFFSFSKKSESGSPQKAIPQIFQLSDRSQTTISHEIFSKTKFYVFLFITWLLPRSKLEHRMLALRKSLSVFFTLQNYYSFII